MIGRQRFGPIAIANSDAGAAAFTNQAIDEAHRAVQELFVEPRPFVARTVKKQSADYADSPDAEFDSCR